MTKENVSVKSFLNNFCFISFHLVDVFIKPYFFYYLKSIWIIIQGDDESEFSCEWHKCLAVTLQLSWKIIFKYFIYQCVKVLHSLELEQSLLYVIFSHTLLFYLTSQANNSLSISYLIHLTLKITYCNNLLTGVSKVTLSAHFIFYLSLTLTL